MAAAGCELDFAAVTAESLATDVALGFVAGFFGCGAGAACAGAGRAAESPGTTEFFAAGCFAFFTR